MCGGQQTVPDTRLAQEWFLLEGPPMAAQTKGVLVNHLNTISGNSNALHNARFVQCCKVYNYNKSTITL